MVSLALRSFVKRQLRDWPLARERFAGLADIRTRSVVLNGCAVQIQYNPLRIHSCTAPEGGPGGAVGCPLCPPLAFPEQHSLPVKTAQGHDYFIRLNPFPIFSRHLTIVAARHTPQQIEGRIEDLLELAGRMPGYVLFYNAADCGASIPEHFHFQAVPRGVLPLEAHFRTLCRKGGRSLNAVSKHLQCCTLTQWPVRQVILGSCDLLMLADAFDVLWEKSYQLEPDKDPMVNLMAWKSGHRTYLCFFPRRASRPAIYYAKGKEQLLFSPASVEMAGVVIAPREEDYNRYDAALLEQCYREVTVDDKWFFRLIL